MSHFSVGVIIDSLEERLIEERIAPYSENIEVEPYIDLTKEEIINLAKQRKNEFINISLKGEELSDWQKEYVLALTDEQLYNLEKLDGEEFDEHGNQITRYNPLSKWDWWQIGGRWSCELFVKNAYMDFGKISEIDFTKMPRNKEKQYNDAILYWELFVEEREPANEEEENFKANSFFPYKKSYLIARYETKEYYAEMQSTWHTHALVDENGWHECGNMGWWGVDDSTKDSEIAYIEEFNKILQDPKNQDKYLVIIDCHI